MRRHSSDLKALSPQKPVTGLDVSTSPAGLFRSGEALRLARCLSTPPALRAQHTRSWEVASPAIHKGRERRALGRRCLRARRPSEPIS